MNKKYLKPLVIGVFSCGLVACASPAREPSSTDYDEPPRGSDCIFDRTVRDYTVLDESNLVVTASAKRNYHIELFRRAPGLGSSWKIGFQAPSGRICPGFSKVIVDSGFGPTTINIRSVRRLTPDEYDDLLIRYRTREPEDVEAPAAEAVDGAEVEELD